MTTAEQEDPLSSAQEVVSSQEHQQSPAEVFKLAPFNPSGVQIQEKAMRLLKLTGDDVLFDLGCGDGRLLITAATRHPGLRCVGVDIDPIFVTRAQQAIQDLPDVELRDRLDIRLEDALQQPMSASSTPRPPPASLATTKLTLMDDATALYLFVLPKGVNKLLPLLEALVETRQQQRRPFRILSYMFKLHRWEPTYIDKTSKAGCPVYLYEFPIIENGVDC
jgi:SAM-dependent methyltransferase